MRGTKAKRLRKAGLRSGPQKRPEREVRHLDCGWVRTSRTPLVRDPFTEGRAVQKRVRRAQRNRALVIGSWS